ncbi:hypothetical protein CHARACLAT_009078 [Characodon lateralis]|uniref:Uncharacterized protein n=1 Tax=Characodon lateralis TaxID=208331 RepID=A0ABU7D5Z3_9TELE|nr:hypothetical protein [Characodon lateralis]
MLTVNSGEGLNDSETHKDQRIIRYSCSCRPSPVQVPAMFSSVSYVLCLKAQSVSFAHRVRSEDRALPVMSRCLCEICSLNSHGFLPRWLASTPPRPP